MVQKITPEAKAVIKALSIYGEDSAYRFAGWTLAYLLDAQQHRRFMLLYTGYQEGRK